MRLQSEWRRRANIVSLKVLGPDGSGKASSVIKAIDWAIDNRRQYQHPHHQSLVGYVSHSVVARRPCLPGR